MKGQITLEEYLKKQEHEIKHCGICICRNCMYWWSDRCPYGECYDDHRALEKPYDKIYPEKSPRTAWSDWNKPGEQQHWCRGGISYPVHYCDHFMKYKGQQVKSCIKANVSIFQDGYINCSMLENYGCEKCYTELEAQQDKEDEE